MSTSEKNLFNTIFLIVLFVALVYLSQPLDSSSIGSVIVMGVVTLQAILKYVHDYNNQTGIEHTWFKVFVMISSLFIIVYLFWVHQWIIIKSVLWVLEGSIFYGYVKKLMINKLPTRSK